MRRSPCHCFTGDSEAQNQPDKITDFARKLNVPSSWFSVEAYRRFNSQPRKPAIDIITSLVFFRTFPPLWIRCQENASSSIETCTKCYAKRGLEVALPEYRADMRCTQCIVDREKAAGAMDDDAASNSVAEEFSFTVRLLSFDAAAKPRVIEEVKSMHGLSLEESEKFVKTLPKVLKTEVTKKEGEKIVAMFKGLGGVTVVNLLPDFHPHTHDTREQDSWKFSEYMDKLAVVFKSSRSEGLQICAIVTNPDRKLMSESFTFSDKLFMSLRRRHSYLYRIPIRALQLLLIFEWEGASPYKRWDGKSSIRGEPAGTDCGRFRPDHRLHFSHSLEKFDDLPSLDTADVSLQPRQPNYSFNWQLSCPSCDSDFQIYLWESWKETPKSETADIHIHTPPDRGILSDYEPKSATKILAVFKSSPAMEAFREKMRVHYWEAPTFQSEEITSHWCSSSLSEDVILTLTILSVIDVLISDTQKFVKDCFKQIQNMVGASNALETLTNVKVTFLSRPAFILHPRAKQELQKIMEIRERDLKYLLERLMAASSSIRERQEMIKEYLVLTHDHRAFVLTVVAALYLPLSLVTGILSMNITLNPPEGSRGFSSFLNSAIKGLQSDTPNATVAVLSSLNTTSVFLWNLKWFGIFAGPLVLTVPLSVAIGKLLRISAKSWYHYRIYWRLIIVAIAFLLFPTIYWVLPYYSRKYQSADGFGGFPPGYIAYIVLNVVFLGLFAVYRLFYALYKEEDQVIWFIFLFIVAACFGIDFSPLLPGQLPLDPIMAVPWLYLVGLWLRPYFYNHGGKEQNKASRNDSMVEMSTSSNGTCQPPRTASTA